jgi:altronate hydrolase
MKTKVLKVHPNDNVIVALQNLQRGETVQLNGSSYQMQEDIPAKHKFTAIELNEGDAVTMYGVLVGQSKKTNHNGFKNFNRKSYTRFR